MGKLNIVYFTFFIATCLIGSTTAGYKINKNNTRLVRKQVDLEMQASLFYQAYGHFFEHSKQALHGFAHYFYEQSLEEKKHADKLMTYLNQRGVQVKPFTDNLKLCDMKTSADLDVLQYQDLCKHITGLHSSWKNTTICATKQAIEDAITLENVVYKELETIANTGDVQLTHFIEHEYLDEQVESIKELEDYKSQLENIDEAYVGLLLIDRWLMEKKKTE